MSSITMSLEQLVTNVDHLPALPQVLMQVSQLIDKDDIRAEDLAAVIKLDADLTVQLLKLCNSAYIGFPRQVSSIKEAVAILGLKTIRSMVYTLMSHQVFNKRMAGYQLEAGDLWRNALLGAEFARYLSTKYQLADPDTAFTAAVLRDLGKIVLESYVANCFAKIEAYAKANRVGFDTAEQAVLGFSHMDVGYRLAEKWGFAPPLKAAIAYHHQPAQAPPDTDPKVVKLLAVVHLADAYSMMLGTGTGGDGLMYAVDFAFLKTHGFDLEDGLGETLMIELLPLQAKVTSLTDTLTGAKPKAKATARGGR
jgi:HD-like signal output (HDOD) protein